MQPTFAGSCAGEGIKLLSLPPTWWALVSTAAVITRVVRAAAASLDAMADEPALAPARDFAKCGHRVWTGPAVTTDDQAPGR